MAALAAARAAVSPVFAVSDEVDGGGWSWLFNPAWRPDENTLVYLSISYGEKSGAANLGASPGQPVITRPETSISYEIGVRRQFLGGRGRIAINAYWNDIEGFQANQQDPTSITPRVFLANVGSVRLKGVEFEGSFWLGTDLKASFSGAYNDARYVSYRNAPPPVEFTFAGGPLSLDYSGLRIPNIPLWSGQISLDYDRTLANGLSLFGYVNERWRSDVRQASPVSSYGFQPGYGILNAGFGVRWADERYSLQVWVKNARDEDYAVGQGSPTGSTPGISILGDPRQVGVTLTVRTP